MRVLGVRPRHGRPAAWPRSRAGSGCGLDAVGPRFIGELFGNLPPLCPDAPENCLEIVKGRQEAAGLGCRCPLTSAPTLARRATPLRPQGVPVDNLLRAALMP